MTYGNTKLRVFWNGRIDSLCKGGRGGVKREWMTRSDKPDHYGYPSIGIDGKMVKVHRLVLLAFIGESELQVDHKNQVKTDNRLCNLHYVTHQENSLNVDRIYNSKGYYLHKPSNKWIAKININGKSKHLGYFDKEENARNAYEQAKRTYGRV